MPLPQDSTLWLHDIHDWSEDDRTLDTQIQTLEKTLEDASSIASDSQEELQALYSDLQAVQNLIKEKALNPEEEKVLFENCQSTLSNLQKNS